MDELWKQLAFRSKGPFPGAIVPLSTEMLHWVNGTSHQDWPAFTPLALPGNSPSAIAQTELSAPDNISELWMVSQWPKVFHLEKYLDLIILLGTQDRAFGHALPTACKKR